MDVEESGVFGEPRVPDEIDLAIVHALQIAPRASWSVLGRVLGCDPVTVARRWQRLVDEGQAWITVSPGPGLFRQVCTAFVEIDCEGPQRSRIAAELSGDPHAVTVEHTAGGHPLLVTAATAGPAALSDYVVDRVGVLAGVRAVRTRVVTEFFAEGGHWRLNVLNRAQRTALTEAVRRPRDTGVIRPGDRELLVELAADGRVGYSVVAARLGVSAATAARRIRRLLDEQVITLRCELARTIAGWPVTAVFWGRVPANELEATGRELAELPEVRNCAAVTGETNLLLQVWLHSVPEIARLEADINRRHPQIAFAERALVLRQAKLMGRRLDRWGRSTQAVIPDVWQPPRTAH